MRYGAYTGGMGPPVTSALVLALPEAFIGGPMYRALGQGTDFAVAESCVSKRKQVRPFIAEGIVGCIGRIVTPLFATISPGAEADDTLCTTRLLNCKNPVSFPLPFPPIG